MATVEVKRSEAEKLVANGGRILQYRTTPEGVMCLVQTADDAPAEAEKQPKRRGRPPKSASKG